MAESHKECGDVSCFRERVIFGLIGNGPSWKSDVCLIEVQNNNVFKVLGRPQMHRATQINSIIMHLKLWFDNKLQEKKSKLQL